MITSIAHIALLVRDYDEAIGFYCGKLGFVLAEDTVISSTKRFIRLKPADDGGSQILLSKINPNHQAEVDALGNQAGGRVLFFMNTDDFDADYTVFGSRGVKFIGLPREEPYGKVAVMQDLYGNRIDLIQPAQA